MNTILNQLPEPVKPPTNDIHVTFNNNKKGEGPTVVLSICTSLACFEPPTTVQQNYYSDFSYWTNAVSYLQIVG